MAIEFARIEYVSRSSGGNACLKAAYNERAAIQCERTGQAFNFKSKSDLSYHEILLPEGVDERFKQSSFLWNAAENAEKRKDSQVAKESVIALPDNKEITHNDRIEITKRYANALFVSKGLAAQINIHQPHDGEKNWHAHVLATTRGFTEDGLSLSPYKARETDPTIRKGYIQKQVTPGELYTQIQNDYFKEKGLDIRVDPTNIIGEKHIGPVRMRKHMGEALERANLLKEANEEAIRNPSDILNKLTRHQATFTEKDLERLLDKHLDREDIPKIKEAVLSDAGIIRLYDKSSHQEISCFTTKAIRAEEEKLLRMSESVHTRGNKNLEKDIVNHKINSSSLTPEQQEAVTYATLETKGLAIIEGRAGTGKSFTMKHIREIYETSRYRVIGLVPTNQVVQDMTKEGFQEAHTVHSFLFKAKNNRLPSLNKDTVLVVDEAAMLGNNAMVELLNTAKNTNAKVVLFGDDRQLSSVERGGMFSELIERFGSQELTEVRRQSGWHKQVSEHLSHKQGREAAELLDKNKAIQWSGSKEEALKQLVEDWAKDTAWNPEQERLILASRNVDVDVLNKAVRDILLQRGDISKTGYRCQTARGSETFSVNDRVCLTETDKKLSLYNGTFATIKELNEKQCTLDLGEGKEVSFDPNTYRGLKLGYAATVYKSQGKSIPVIYALHDPHAGSQLNYVALTRHKESLKVYVNQEETKSLYHFASQLTRERGKGSSLQYFTQKEVQAYEKQREREGIHSFWQSMKNTVKNYLSDTFHKNEEFYQFKDKNAGKEQSFLPVEKVKEEEQNIEQSLPETPAPVQRDWANLIAEKEEQLKHLTLEEAVAKVQRQIAGTDELYERQKAARESNPKYIAYQTALKSKDSSEVIQSLLKENPSYNAGPDMVECVGKAYCYLRDIASNGPALSEKENLHLLKQCVYAVGTSLHHRQGTQDQNSLISRRNAEKMAWRDATKVSKNDSLTIEVPYERVEQVASFNKGWNQAIQNSTEKLSFAYPHMDKGIAESLAQESLRIGSLLPNHKAQAREFILEKGLEIQGANSDLLKQASELVNTFKEGDPHKLESRQHCAKDLLIKEMLASKEDSRSTFSEKIVLESKQEQQRISFIQERSSQEQRQQDLERQFTL